jgi:hypothetical protein
METTIFPKTRTVKGETNENNKTLCITCGIYDGTRRRQHCL